LCDRGVTNVMRLSFEIGKKIRGAYQKREWRMGPMEGGLTSVWWDLYPRSSQKKVPLWLPEAGPCTLYVELRSYFFSSFLSSFFSSFFALSFFAGFFSFSGATASFVPAFSFLAPDILTNVMAPFLYCTATLSPTVT